MYMSQIRFIPPMRLTAVLRRWRSASPSSTNQRSTAVGDPVQVPRLGQSLTERDNFVIYFAVLF
jgi:hypothetical protein